MATYLDDLVFVISEIDRIRDERMTGIRQGLSFEEALAALPLSSGGHLRCGLAAYRRLQNMAERAVAKSSNNGRVDVESVSQHLRSIVAERFVVEGRELDQREADRAVGAAMRAATKECRDLTHYIACHLGEAETPNSFAIGPVIFQQRALVMGALDPALEVYVQKGSDAASNINERATERRKASEELLADARAYYGSFGWVAAVTVQGCDPPTSRKRAARMVQNALDCLHLIIGRSGSNHMRLGGPNFFTDRRSHIQVDGVGRADISFSVSWLTHLFREDWWQSVNNNGGDNLIALMGAAIVAGNQLPKPAPMSQRFLDAVAWYGEAVRDEFVASRMVKYITAVERIVTTENEQNLVETISRRGAALTFNPETDDLAELRGRFANAYNIRSRLVHGSWSPFDVKLRKGLRDAEELTRRVLVRCLELFGQRGLEEQTVGTTKLESAFARLITWSEDLEKPIEPGIS